MFAKLRPAVPRCPSMSAVELAIEKVKHLDETHAQQLLAWLQAHEAAAPARAVPL